MSTSEVGENCLVALPSIKMTRNDTFLNENASGVQFCTLFCGPGSQSVSKLALKYYAEASVDISFCIVTPRCLTSDFAWIKALGNVRLGFDEDIQGYQEVRDFLITKRPKLEKLGRTIGWYLQQYLKLAHAWSATDPLFIHDGDTVFSPSLLASLRRSIFLITTKEDIQRYSIAAEAMGLRSHDRSFIANGGIFIPEVLKKLGADPAIWFMKFMEGGVLENHNGGDFSEYQIMGALLVDRYPVRRIKTFRRVDVLVRGLNDIKVQNLLYNTLRHYDAIAFEKTHASSLLKQLAIRAAYRMRYSW